MKTIIKWVAVSFACYLPLAQACDTPVSVCHQQNDASFSLIHKGKPAVLYIDSNSDSAVQLAAKNFAEDLKRISGRSTKTLKKITSSKTPVIILGVLGQSAVLDELIAAKKLNVEAITHQWEAFTQAVVENPWPGVERALVIAGSDRRGAVYGIYDLSEKMGVSPWHYFADVPVEKKSELYLTQGARSDQPKVRYRGFFINDEDPAFSGWATEQFGGINAGVYEHVFELLLRLKGNYLWPAMWSPKSFHLDDPKNRVLADQMGVVMGTSHHEPLTRAQSEWHRLVTNNNPNVRWNYQTHAADLQAFWRGAMERMMEKGDGQTYENLITVGMRGDGDEPMDGGTATDLLEKIVYDQRQIIRDVTGRPAEQTPQVWAIYKEVQEYYDQGMQVPDDITLLFADDNWGQIRRLPTKDLDRTGGFGVYYHFDYVGGPRSYKWLNTVQIEKTWQQMDLAYQRDAKTIWIVNVGDIKPVEYPLDFFMKMAWNPELMTPEALAAYPEEWAHNTFGEALAKPIAALMTDYSQAAAKRKPELVDPDTYAVGTVRPDVLVKGEWDAIVDHWRTLAARSDAIKARLPAHLHSSYFQLIEYPVQAVKNLYEMYWATAWNRALASNHDARANYFLKIVEDNYARDAKLVDEFHRLENGKWNHMMSQVHMGYVIWHSPTQHAMPSVMRIAADKPVADRNVIPVMRESNSTGDKKSWVLAVENFTAAANQASVNWVFIPGIGQRLGALMSYPQGQPATSLADKIVASHPWQAPATGDYQVTVVFSPTLDTLGSGHLRVGVSLGAAPAQIIDIQLEPTGGKYVTPAEKAWAAAVIDNAHRETVVFKGVKSGEQPLKLWRLDDNIVIEKIDITSYQQ